MPGYRATGSGTDRLVVGVANPVRVRAMSLLDKGDLSEDRAATVRKLLAAPSIKWTEWNNLVDWVKLNKILTNDSE